MQIMFSKIISYCKWLIVQKQRLDKTLPPYLFYTSYKMAHYQKNIGEMR